jgi:heme-degrading monooxygenase HmoA
MSVVKINAITVPEGSGDELANRFAKRLGAVDGQPGFEEFQLLRPTDDRNTWLVYTRWADEESFQAWMNGPSFAHGHQGAGGGPGGAGGPGGPGGHGGQAPVAVSSELWQFTVEQQSSGKGL